MALTKISTDGVKDDAVTAGKIPANAVGSSELADNAVDTAAIADDAVTSAKIANNTITSANIADNAITTDAIANGNITNVKLNSNSVDSNELVASSVTTAKIADDAVTADKLANSINTAIAANTAKDLTALSASNLTSGTVPDARFPATLPAISGASLTNLPTKGTNLVINGSMAVSQRNTTFSPSGTDQIYTLDRFEHLATGGAVGDCTITQNQSYNISGVGDMKSYKITPDATNTPTGGGNVVIRHQIEGQNLQHLEYGTSNAKSITISFFAKTAAANSGDQYTLCLFHKRSGDDAQRTINASFTPTSSWQRFTLTFAGDTDTSYDIKDGNGGAMTLTWILASGPDDIMSQKSSWATDGGYFRAVTGQSNFMDNTGNEFFMTGVQMEVGTSASDFVQESYADTLIKCKRYFQNHAPVNSDHMMWGVGRAEGNTGRIGLPVSVPMRAAPTVACGQNRLMRYDGAGSDSTDTPSVFAASDWISEANVYTIDFGGHSLSHNNMYNLTSSANGGLTFDSEI